MGTTQTLNIRMSEELQHWLEEQVAQGFYRSKSEALRSILREMIHGG